MVFRPGTRLLDVGCGVGGRSCKRDCTLLQCQYHWGEYRRLSNWPCSPLCNGCWPGKSGPVCERQLYEAFRAIR
ncbi:hypothetical protein BGW80DRAFT_1296501 [Lactifluus volemus]|nr:hypothetical protein BGW80DRAFT_1296501 [Lactifluus volemus]